MFGLQLCKSGQSVLNGETFKISDFKGQKVLLESFAVWCPTCTQQQKEIKQLIEQGDQSIHISLDTDPNEDSSSVLSHVEEKGFDWNYAISPKTLTQSLIDINDIPMIERIQRFMLAPIKFSRIAGLEAKQKVRSASLTKGKKKVKPESKAVIKAKAALKEKARAKAKAKIRAKAKK